jgi:ribosomal protein S18
MEQALNLIVSFLGGGIIGGLINWARVSRTEKEGRKSEALLNQVKFLYGPLYFFVGQNESLFDLNNKFHSAYTDHFVNQKWSSDTHTQESIKKEAETTIELSNYYVRMTRNNNKKICEILRENYSYIDPNDTEIFQRFITDHLRMEKEFKEGEPLETPFEIYNKVGEISFMRKEFSDLVKGEFIRKTKEIRRLQR